MIPIISKYKFGTTSTARLNTCHSDIVKVFNVVIAISKVDISIVYGRRSTVEQQNLFAQGRTTPGSIVTNCDGIEIKSNHQSDQDIELIPNTPEDIRGNSYKAKAVDVAAYVNGKLNWDVSYLSYISGVVDVVSEMLYMQGEITHKIKWGGNLDGDGEIITDQTLVDLPHYEIIN